MNITLTNYELNCLIDLLEVDEEIFHEVIEDEERLGRQDTCDYEHTLLNLLDRFREMRDNIV